MKALFSKSTRSQQSVDISSPYPPSALSPDPRNPPPQYHRTPDQLQHPHQQIQQLQQHQQQQQQQLQQQHLQQQQLQQQQQHQQQQQLQPQQQQQQPLPPAPVLADAQDLLTRSPSERRSLQPQPSQPPPEHQQQQPIAFVPSGHPSLELNPSDHRDHREHRYSSYLPTHSAHPPPHEKEERRRFRDIIGLGSNKQGAEQQPGAKVGGVGRTLSRRKGSPNPDKYASPTDEAHRPTWARNNSSQLLLSPNEAEEESQHNTFIANRQYGAGPPVPLKDQEYEQALQQQQSQQQLLQQHQQQQQQEYYPPPGSAQQPPSNQSFTTQGSAEHYISPDHQSQQPPQPPPHYVAYSDQHLPQNPQQQYQYPPPQSAGAPVQAKAAQPGEAPAGYHYQPPQEHQYTQHTSQQPTASQQPTSHQQEPQFQVQAATPGEQQLELHQPQATRKSLAAQNQQGKLFLQAPQTTGSSHGPPSPLAGQAPPLDTQHIAPPQPPSPSGTQRSAPSPDMPPPGPSRTIRQIDGKGMQTSSRESSLTGHHPQGSGDQSGVHSYPANIVPPGSQGQPYRGQDGDHGRSTPPPRGTSDMTDDEITHYQQLVKDHKELKEKYQKVKKYYFEKESQVHQLQNTLAHQRLSASRTSLDDSEYAARFSRLEGLTAQLSFSIRKSWNKIPEWLHRAVNKDAIATGKQEMTAVGRAYISWWLWTEIFERIFHPDLEMSLSVQLKSIANTIRRNAPPFQSGEEEEALAAKLSSWRMATLEGLQDQLRSPVAAQHKAALIHSLNEKLIANISAYLVDPAPPDLAGGVFMIVELAVNIAVHLPVESREVGIEYYPPLYVVVQEVMKLEQGIPALTSPILADTSPSDSLPDSASLKGSTGDKEGSSSTGQDSGSRNSADEQPSAAAGSGLGQREEKRGGRGMLANLMGGGKSTGPAQQPPGGPPPKPGSSGSGATGNKAASGGRDTPAQKEERVRFAIGLGVVIRGRSVLVKAPVYTTMV